MNSFFSQSMHIVYGSLSCTAHALIIEQKKEDSAAKGHVSKCYFVKLDGGTSPLELIITIM